MNHAVLRDAEVATQLMGGDALFMTADEAHRDEPFPQGNLGVLKDGSDGHGEINHRRIFWGSQKGLADRQPLLHTKCIHAIITVH